MEDRHLTRALEAAYGRKEAEGETESLDIHRELGRLNAIIDHATTMKIDAEEQLFELRVSLSIERRYNEELRNQREELQRKLGALQQYCDTWAIIRWEKWIRSNFPGSAQQQPATPSTTGNCSDWDEELAQIEANRIKLEARERETE